MKTISPCAARLSKRSGLAAGSLDERDNLLICRRTPAHHHVVAEADELSTQGIADRAGAEYADFHATIPRKVRRWLASPTREVTSGRIHFFATDEGMTHGQAVGEVHHVRAGAAMQVTIGPVRPIASAG